MGAARLIWSFIPVRGPLSGSVDMQPNRSDAHFLCLLLLPASARCLSVALRDSGVPAVTL